MQTPSERLLTILKNSHNNIFGVEEAALNALSLSNTQNYIEKMHEKANLLSLLDSETENCFIELKAPFWNKCKKAIKQFSANARLALDLDSVFFMSALLYPEDYVKGMPDNLEKLITEIEAFLNTEKL